jgi:hypothetical protein
MRGALVRGPARASRNHESRASWTHVPRYFPVSPGRGIPVCPDVAMSKVSLPRPPSP